MKKQKKSHILISLQSLGIILVMFMAMAFACGDKNKSRTSRSGDTTRQNETKSSGGRCSTEDEFKDILMKNYSETFNERDGKFKETEVDFETFEIGDAMRYTNSYPIVDAYPAYPVKTNHTKRDYVHGGTNPEILEYEIEGKYMFYTDHHGDCVFVSDGGKRSEGKYIPYDQ